MHLDQCWRLSHSVNVRKLADIARVLVRELSDSLRKSIDCRPTAVSEPTSPSTRSELASGMVGPGATAIRPLSRLPPVRRANLEGQLRSGAVGC
jgi:hypothetical protein